jgi:hypothetical protein
MNSASSDAKIDAYQCKEASWGQILVVQPPVKRMDIIKKEGWQTGSFEFEGKLLAHRGLKMGVLYDSVEEEAHSGDHFDSMSFDLEWHMFVPPAHLKGKGFSDFCGIGWIIWPWKYITRDRI